jgi:hypothetical protein
MKKSHKKVLRVLEFRNHKDFVKGLTKKIPVEVNKLDKQVRKRYPDSEKARWTKAVKNVFHAAARKKDD